MKLSPLALLAEDFAPSIRSRGDAYRRSGRVRIERGDARSVHAVVRGTMPYAVDLRRAGDEIEALCSCPYLRDQGRLCKHVWAALMLALDRGFLAGPRTGPPSGASVRVPAAPDGAIGDAETGAVRPGRKPERPGDPAIAGDGMPGGRAPRLPAFASSIPGPVHPLSEVRQILYVVDRAESRTLGGLVIRLRQRVRKRNGAWGKPKPLRLERDHAERLPDPDDRRALAVLGGSSAGLELPWNSWGRRSFVMLPTDFRLPAPVIELALPLLSRTGRLCRLDESDEEAVHVVQWDGDAGPWRPTISLRRVASAAHFRLTGVLRRGTESIDLGDPDLLLVSGALLHRDRIAPVGSPELLPWMRELGRGAAVTVPESEIPRLLERLCEIPEPPELDLPEELDLPVVRVPPRPHLKIGAGGRRGLRLPVDLLFDYAGTAIRAAQSGARIIDAAGKRIVERDRDAERAAIERLFALGFGAARVENRGEPPFELGPVRLPGAAAALVREGWQVEAEGKLVRGAGSFSVQVVSGVDWFDVRGAARFGEQDVPLPKLLAALRRKQQWIALGDGTFGLLPEEWLGKYAHLGRIGSVEGEGLRFRRSQVSLIDALLAGHPEVDRDAGFERARAELDRFTGIAPEDPPSSFRGTLRDYQREGLGWFGFLERFDFGGCLADDMGLGKTVQVLALFAARTAEGGRRRPSLVVAPRSLLFNWREEAERFTPHLRWREHAGPGRGRTLRAFAGCDVVITTYGTLRRDAPLFERAEFDCIVLDEAQAIKNAKTQAAKAARLLKGRRRLALSGTPIENHLGDLWSLFEFLNPGMLGHASLFRDAADGDAETTAETRALLGKALRPFILRRTKGQVARELPARTEQTLHCDMQTEQRRLYDEMRAYYRAALESRVARQGIERSGIQILEALLRLRQAACHPGLLDEGRREAACAKFDVLFPHLEEVTEEGHKALVFSQFTSFLALARAGLDARGIAYSWLDGRTRNRGEAVRRFQEDPGCRVFLISLKAGGVGLNLTAAEYVYLLDPWWNPAVEAQAIDRTHRIGQTNPVFAYRLVARDTVEERILELQAGKRELADSIIRADERLIANLTREDLELLLS